MIKAVIFDLDGTLLDTLEDLANACNYALRSCGYKEHAVKDYVRFVGSGRYVLIQRILPEADRENKDIINKVLAFFDEYYGEHMLDTTKPYDGISGMIDELKKNNIRLAVVSNKPDEFAGEVVKKYFDDKFEITYGQRPNHAVKPDPRTVYEVIDYLKVSKEECVYVGDSDVDMLTAKNANVKSIGVAWGFRGEDELINGGANHIIQNPNELLELIK